MWPIVFLGLFIASLAGWLFTWWSQRLRIRQLERSKEEIQIEETLVFDFLHGLGEAFTETIRAADLHRLIGMEAGQLLLVALGRKPVKRRRTSRGGVCLQAEFDVQGCAVFEGAKSAAEMDSNPDRGCFAMR